MKVKHAVILLAFILSWPLTGRGETKCEEFAKSWGHTSAVRVAAAGTVLSVTFTEEGMPIVENFVIKTFDDVFNEHAARAGCTEVVFLERSGKVVQHPTLTSSPTTAPTTAANHELPKDTSAEQATTETEQTEEPTAENFDKLLDTFIGFLRRKLAVIKELQTWYEIEPDHPDAVALKQELCSNRMRGIELMKHYLAFVGSEPADDRRYKTIVNLGRSDAKLLAKFEREGELFDDVRSAEQELEGMGFSCSQ